MKQITAVTKKSAMPSLAARVVNFSGAVSRAVRAAASGRPVLAEQDAVQTRLALCEVCEHHSKQFCRRCGCWVKAKVRAAQEWCPVGKW